MEAISKYMSFYRLEQNHLASSQHAAPSLVWSLRRPHKRSLKIISIRKPRYTFKSRRKPIIQRFQLQRPRTTRVNISLMQQQRLLAVILICFLISDPWFKELICVQVNVRFGVKSTLSSLNRIVHPMLELLFISCFLLLDTHGWRDRFWLRHSVLVLDRRVSQVWVRVFESVLNLGCAGEILVSSLVYGKIYLVFIVLNTRYIVNITSIRFNHSCFIRNVPLSLWQIIRTFFRCRVLFTLSRLV